MPQVDLAVKLPSAFALKDESPSNPRKPMPASITFWKRTLHINFLLRVPDSWVLPQS